MKAVRNRCLPLITALVASAHPAFAAPPPNVVDSDANRNTAMGTDALGSLTNGFDNTAAGSEALGSNTTGVPTRPSVHWRFKTTLQAATTPHSAVKRSCSMTQATPMSRSA